MMLSSLLAPLRGSLHSRASIENPAFNLSDPAAYDNLGASPSSAGVRVGEREALSYPPMWRGINLISRDVGKLPLVVYERSGEGKNRAVAHPAYNILRYSPNAYAEAFILKQTVQAHALLRGNGYLYVFRNAGGVPLELLILDPSTTYPVRENGVLWYVTTVGGEDRRLSSSDVIHIRGLGFDGLVGYDAITYMRECLGRGIAAATFASMYFKNSARPSVVLEHPMRLSEAAQKRLREGWQSMHAGIENSHRMAILEEGAKLHAFSADAKDAQLLEMRQFEIRDVANLLGVPPHKLGDTSRQGYNSLEQENQSYLDDAIDPWLVVWEEACRSKLLTEQEKRDDSHVIEFLRNALVRADIKSRSDFYAKATAGHPFMTVNEVRSRENLNPLDGYDEIAKPTNNFGGDGEPAADVPADDPAPVAPADQPDDSERKMLARVKAFDRITRRAADQIRKAAKSPSGFGEFLERMAEFDVWAEESVGTVLDLCGVDVSVAVKRWRNAIQDECDRVYSSSPGSTFEAGIVAMLNRVCVELPSRLSAA